MSGILVKPKAAALKVGSRTKMIVALALVATIGVSAFTLGGGFNTAIDSNTPIIPIVSVDNQPTASPAPGDNPFDINDPAPTATPSPRPSTSPYPITNDEPLDPVGWGYAQSASYIIASRPGSGGITWYGAYNTTSARWVTDWSSTNPNVVITNALGANRTILFKNGNYGTNITFSISATYDNLKLVAETNEGVIFGQSDKTKSIIEILGTSGDYINNVVIDGFKLVGAGSASAGAQSGIRLQYASFCTIENNRLEDMSSAEATNGIASILLHDYCFNNTVTKNTILRGTFEGIGNAGGWNNEISYNYIIYPLDNCIDLNGDGDTLGKGNLVIGNQLWGGGTSITLDAAKYNIISDNVMYDPITNGISIGNGANNNVFTSNTVWLTLNGFIAANSNDNIINTITVNNCTNSIQFSATSTGNTVNNLYSNYASGYGFYTQLSNFNALNGGSIQHSGSRGIEIVNCNDTSVTGGLLITTSAAQGIVMEGYSLRTLITGIRVMNNGWTSVQEDDTTDYTLLTGNILNGNGATNTVDAANSVNQHNVGTG